MIIYIYIYTCVLFCFDAVGSFDWFPGDGDVLIVFYWC